MHFAMRSMVIPLVLVGALVVAPTPTAAAREPEQPCYECKRFGQLPYSYEACTLLTWEIGYFQVGARNCSQTWEGGQITECNLSGQTCVTGTWPLADGSTGLIEGARGGGVRRVLACESGSTEPITVDANALRSITL
jgi:hypothetical protein